MARNLEVEQLTPQKMIKENKQKMKQIIKLLDKYHIAPNVLLDQHFMVDSKIINKLISAAKIRKNDVVVEVGAGLGTVAGKIQNKCKKLILIEIDEPLAGVLKAEVPSAQIIHGNALDEITKLDFNKLISNLPYSICEPFVYKLLGRDFEIAVLTIPEKFADKLFEKNSKFAFFAAAFFDVSKIAEVKKQAFYPVPRVDSCITKLIPKKKVSDADFIMQQLYLQRDKKLKNALREALILRFGLTKKQANNKINELDLQNDALDSLVLSLSASSLFKLENQLSLI